MNISTNGIELKTVKEQRRFANGLDRIIEHLMQCDYGVYRIKKEQKPFFIMIGNMATVQQLTNKGVRVLGGFDTLKIEIFNYAEHQSILDKAIDDFSL